MSRAVQWSVIAAIVIGFCARNLPWHLDNFDQAKQAFTSFEMIEDGHWFFQHTPSGKIATKPPLTGWISAVIYGVTRSWEIAWRFPPLLASLVLMRLLWRSGKNMHSHLERSGPSTLLSKCWGNEVERPRRSTGDVAAESLLNPRGLSTAQSFAAAHLCSARDDREKLNVASLLAVSAFGLNLVTPRLATLVRTDMLLTLFIFLAGWLIYERVRTSSEWRTRDRLVLFAAMLASMLTKGPIAFAFLLPGLVAFQIIMHRRGEASHVWSGWWPWLVPLLFFGAWLEVGIATDDEFYKQVVQREFLGRFTVGEEAVHHNRPPGDYTLGLLGRFAPWSLALIALAFSKKVRLQICRDPALLWLACWSLGGLAFMECVPSKRFDRIFPIFPPLCLLLDGMFAAWESPRRVHALRIGLATAFAASLGYTGWQVATAFRTDQRALVRFGEQVRNAVRMNGWRYGILGAKDEGMLLYLRQTQPVENADDRWHREELDALVLSENALEKNGKDFEPYSVLMQTAKVPEKNSRYFFIVRKDIAPKP